MPTHAIVAENLTYRYGDLLAVDHINFDVAEGEILGFLGPNGAGKTTTVKILTGQMRPKNGKATLLGMDITQKTEKVQAQIGVCFEISNLYEQMTGIENLKLFSPLFSVKNFDVRALLDRVRLGERGKDRVEDYSKCMKQRLIVARALVPNPKLLLLDEPLSSLDTSVRLSLQEAIRTIQRELGITTMFVTHDLSEAMAMSDRMALLLSGKIIALDKPEVLLHPPPNLRAAEFMGVSTFLTGDQVEIRGEADGLSGKTFAIRPEHICVQKESCSNSMQGTVCDCIFRGEYVEYQVETAQMTIRARMPMPAPMFPHGERVYVEFPAEHLFKIQA